MVRANVLLRTKQNNNTLLSATFNLEPFKSIEQIKENGSEKLSRCSRNLKTLKVAINFRNGMTKQRDVVIPITHSNS